MKPIPENPISCHRIKVLIYSEKNTSEETFHISKLCIKYADKTILQSYT